MRKSTRTKNYEPIYDEAEIYKLLNEKKTSSGSLSVMLAQTYDPERDDPSGWLMSEKLDGVRCYWNGKSMFTRNGNKIYAPKEWTANLPEMALDGELWTERDNF